MCTECNDRFEEEKPWLLERKAAPKDLHNLVHTMVLNTQAAVDSESNMSTNGRLAQLEAKLDKYAEENQAFETAVTVRLQKLEELLERLVVAVTRAA